MMPQATTLQKFAAASVLILAAQTSFGPPQQLHAESQPTPPQASPTPPKPESPPLSAPSPDGKGFDCIDKNLLFQVMPDCGVTCSDALALALLPDCGDPRPMPIPPAQKQMLQQPIRHTP